MESDPHLLSGTEKPQNSGSKIPYKTIVRAAFASALAFELPVPREELTADFTFSERVQRFHDRVSVVFGNGAFERERKGTARPWFELEADLIRLGYTPMSILRIAKAYIPVARSQKQREDQMEGVRQVAVSVAECIPVLGLNFHPYLDVVVAAQLPAMIRATRVMQFEKWMEQLSVRNARIDDPEIILTSARNVAQTLKGSSLQSQEDEELVETVERARTERTACIPAIRLLVARWTKPSGQAAKAMGVGRRHLDTPTHSHRSTGVAERSHNY